jgi:hypothetical protein
MAVSFFAFIALLSVADLSFCRAGHRRQLRARDHARQVPVERAGDLGALGWRIPGGLRRGASGVVIRVTWLALPALASAAYWLLAIMAAIGMGQAVSPPRTASPPTAAGLHSEARARPRSALLRSHPLPRPAGLPAVRNPFWHRARRRPAADDIRRLIAEFPAVLDIRLIVTSTHNAQRQSRRAGRSRRPSPLSAAPDQR